MNSIFARSFLIALALFVAALNASAAGETPRRASALTDTKPSDLNEPELVDIHTVDPTIVIDLRYATNRNILGHPFYPPNMPALVRPSVAERLMHAENELMPKGYRLKIWDAYRPKAAHDELWRSFPNKDYVGNPNDGFGSLHTWGVAVDATLVDNDGREVSMPTDFDAFTRAAMLAYTGKDPQIAAHLHALQRAMAHAGFWGMRTEWWHFIARGWTKYKAIEQVPIFATQAPAATTAQGPSAGESSGGSR